MPRRRRRLLPLLLLLVVGPLLLLLPTARADEATVMMVRDLLISIQSISTHFDPPNSSTACLPIQAPSSVPPPVSLGGAPALPVHGNENDDNRTNQDNTKAADSDESAVAPPTTAALEARFPGIYGPFIPSRDAVVLKGPAPDVVINPKGAPPADKAGQRGYVYVPTGPQGWYANGYGSNYYSACKCGERKRGWGRHWFVGSGLMLIPHAPQPTDPYPPDPYLADSQYYPDYGWDHVHEFPFIYVSKEGTRDRDARLAAAVRRRQVQMAHTYTYIYKQTQLQPQTRRP